VYDVLYESWYFAVWRFGLGLILISMLRRFLRGSGLLE